MTDEQGRVFSAHELEAPARGESGPWHQFFRNAALRAGIYHLKPDQPDLQQPHTEDEIYYVIEGDGEVEIEGRRTPVHPGDAVFVARAVPHRFLNYPRGLTLFVVFGAAP